MGDTLQYEIAGSLELARVEENQKFDLLKAIDIAMVNFENHFQIIMFSFTRSRIKKYKRCKKDK